MKLPNHMIKKVVIYIRNPNFNTEKLREVIEDNLGIEIISKEEYLVDESEAD
jgi:hypothetical protein